MPTPHSHDDARAHDGDNDKHLADEKRMSAALHAPVPPRRSTFKSVCLVLTCTTAMIVNTSNSTSVSIALPTIGEELNIQEAKLQWLVSSYSLSSGCLLLIFGRLADLYGRKITFILGSLWLMAFSLGCGFAQDELTLDILRGFQGIGAAATIPASLGILAHAFPPSRARSAAFAVFASGAPIGAAFGMALGGTITQLAADTWRGVFFLATGLTALCLIGGLISIDADVRSTEVDRRVDWLGATLVTVGLVLIVFVLGQGEVAPQRWGTPYIIALLVVGVLFLGLFHFWQRYLERAAAEPHRRKSAWTPPPLLAPSLWARANGRFTVIMLVAFLQWCAFLSWAFWVQLYYQEYIGLSPVLTMVRLLPMFVTGFLCTVLVGAVVGRVPLVVLIAAGTTLTSTACLLFAVIVPSAPYWAFGFPAAVLAVFGADFVFAAGTLFVARSVHAHEQSLAGALFQTMTQLGTALGVTVTTIVFDRVAARAGQLRGYHAAEWAAMAFGLLAAALALVFLRGVGVVGHTKGEGGGEDAERTVTESPAAGEGAR